jgi:arylsulfatase A-like enzyme
VVPESQVRDQVCIEMDWFATIAQLTKTDIEGSDIDGKSLMPVILDEGSPSPHEILHWQYGSYDDNLAQWAVRAGPWKLLGNPYDPTMQAEPLEDKLFLVNLAMDISEEENLAEKFPEITYKLNQLHGDWLLQVRKEMNE